MKKVIITNKKIGETPLERLEKVRKEEKIDAKTPMTYAGRLDPMAQGLLIILVGEECKNKEKYTNLNKEYELEIIFGIETDTQDVLGLIKKVSTDKPKLIDFNKYIGKFIQKYPAFSSKRLYKEYIEIPEKEVEIYSIEKTDERMESGLKIASNSISKINLVSGDFRQDKILEDWQYFADEFGRIEFKIITLKVMCSSGTYMRTLAENIGKDAGTGGLANLIKRNSVGEYKI
ncbi:MAG TPA: hypothetical protein VJC02_00410 [Candidatus Paceibacterota bacterium]